MKEQLAYSISEVLEILPFGRSHLYAEISKGNLAARKVGRRTVVLASELHRFLENLPTIEVREF